MEQSPQVIAREIAQNCLGVRMRMLNRVITQIYDEELAGFDLKVTQLNILVAVFMLQPVKLRVMCRELLLEVSTGSRNVERMRNRGWLTTESSGDERSPALRLTAKGEELLQKAYPAWQKAQQRVTRRLGEEGIARLQHLAESLKS